MNRNRMLLLALGAAAPLALGACSSSGHGGAGLPVTTAAAGGTGASTSATAAPTSTSTSTGRAGGGTATGWCAELKSAGQAVLALGGSSTDRPDVAKAKIHKLVADAPEEIRPGLEVIEKIDDKILDGDTNADAELATGPNVGLIQRTIKWMQAHCPGSVEGPTG